MGAARASGLLAAAAIMVAIPTGALADTYPPSVAPTEIVTEDVTPSTDVDAEEVVAPADDDVEVAPAVIEAEDEGTLSATGAQVLPLLGAAAVMVLAGGVLARVTRVRGGARR